MIYPRRKYAPDKGNPPRVDLALILAIASAVAVVVLMPAPKLAPREWPVAIRGHGRTNSFALHNNSYVSSGSGWEDRADCGGPLRGAIGRGGMREPRGATNTVEAHLIPFRLGSVLRTPPWLGCHREIP